ncbi:zinc finger protein 37 homolog isoform X2 [Mya arenaria]|uniref:zinc finger protein 37 homolog isoform X2 n=1 Tax=Mya arenaria TaxID=6604 RepID=UPI0022E88689|nr:zinc finger protein 37 homolog isoform X2 [Mya arenaria]
MAAEERDIEETEEFTLAVKYVLKRQMKDLITQMREQGEEMVVMAVNIQDGTSTHFGTPLGDCFITEQKSLTNNFVTFCKSNGQKKSKAVGTQYSSKKIAATPKGRAKAATSASTDAPTLKITVPKKMSVGISEQELGGLVGRIVASQLTQNKAKGDGSSGGTKFDALLESIKKGKAPDTPSGVTRSGRKVSNKYLEGIKSARKRVKLEKEDSGDEEIPESFILNQLTDLEAGAMKKVQVKTGDGKNIDVQKTTLAQAEQMEILATSIIKQLENIPNVAQRKQVKVELKRAAKRDISIAYMDGSERTSNNKRAEGSGLIDDEGDNLESVMDDAQTEYADYVEMKGSDLAELPDDQEFSSLFGNSTTEGDNFGADVGNSDDHLDASRDDDDDDYDEDSADPNWDDDNDEDKEDGKPLPKRRKIASPKKSGKTKRGRKSAANVEEIENPRCELCDMNFTRIDTLVAHNRRVHDKERRAWCDVCNKGFFTKSHMEIHQLAVHTRQCYKCTQYIQETEAWKPDVNRRMLRKFKCPCGVVLKIFPCHDKSVAYADFMAEELPDTADAEDLPLGRVVTGYLSCDPCGKLFQNKHEYDRHIESHKKDSELCNVCNRTFRNKNLLNFHLKRNHGVVDYHCKYCGETSDDKKTLKKHLIEVHGMTQEEPYSGRIRAPMTCDQCGITIRGKNAMKSHINRVHLKKLDYKCKICGKAFWCNSILEGHMLTVHTRRCDDCKNYVVETEKWMEGMNQRVPRRVTCTCGKSIVVVTKHGTKRKFARQGDLQNADGQSDDTRFMCRICTEIFITHEECELHQMVHMEKLKCEYCEKTFTSKRGLRSHVDKVHPRDKVTKASEKGGFPVTVTIVSDAEGMSADAVPPSWEFSIDDK